MNFGRRPSQNPQKLTLAALKFGVGNVKNRRFQLGLVRVLPGFYRNTHREPLNTTTKGFGLEPQRSTGLVFGLKSDSRQYQLVLLGRLSTARRICDQITTSSNQGTCAQTTPVTEPMPFASGFCTDLTSFATSSEAGLLIEEGIAHACESETHWLRLSSKFSLGELPALKAG